MKRKILSLALLSALAFAACDNRHPEVDILLERDFTEVIEAINDANRSLLEKLTLIEGVMAGIPDRDQTLNQMVQTALSSLSGTVEQKLAAIQEALRAGGLSLGTKLTLVQTAVESGFSDYKAQQAMLLQALQAIEGTAEDKLDAIEDAVKAQNTSLETKLALVETAFQNGFADSAQANALLLEAINAAGGTLEEKLAAIEEAVNGQAASLEGKLALLETAVNEGFTDADGQEGLILQAVTALQGSLEEKLAAIESAVKSDNTGLGTKLDLISAALERGIGDRETALGNLKAALDATIQGVDSRLETVKSDIVKAFNALSEKLTTQELATVFKDVADAIGKQGEDYETLLGDLLKAVKSMDDAFDPQIDIVLLDDYSKTVTLVAGNEFTRRLGVTPTNAVLDKDNLTIQYASRKVFLPEDSGADPDPDHFVIRSLEADPDAPGQYVATISANAEIPLWDESVLTLVYKYGRENKEKYVGTKAFPVVMMPHAMDGLKRSYYPNACFEMYLTKVVNGVIQSDWEKGVIYHSLGSKVFKTKDGKDSRTYSVDNLTQVKFVQPNRADTVAVTTVFDKEKHFVSFTPNDKGNDTWRPFLSRHTIDHEHQNVTGKLALTDRWGVTDSLDLSMNWYVCWGIPYEITDDEDNTLKFSDSEWTGNAYVFKYPEFWTKHLGPWGLGIEDLRRCGLELEVNSTGCGDNYRPLVLKLDYDSPSAELIVEDGIKPVNGDKFQQLGTIYLYVRPSDVDPDFRPTQIFYKTQIKLFVTNDD